MPVISTDDQARRLRYIYLGPIGFRFPFDAGFPAIGFWLAVTAFLGLWAVALSPPGTRVAVLGVLLSPLIAIVITRKVMPHVDHDKPIRWWKSILQAELDTPRPLTAPTSRSLALPSDLFKQGTPHGNHVSLHRRARRAVRRGLRLS